MNPDTNAETIRSVWWETSRVTTWPAECQSPVLTFSVIGADEMFKGNKDWLVFLPHHLPGCFKPVVINYSHAIVCLHSHSAHECVFFEHLCVGLCELPWQWSTPPTFMPSLPCSATDNMFPWRAIYPPKIWNVFLSDTPTCITHILLASLC